MPLARSRLLWWLSLPALALAAFAWHGGEGLGGRVTTRPAHRDPQVADIPAMRVGDGFLTERSNALAVSTVASGFDAQRDFYQYARTLAGAAEQGDAQAAWTLSRVYDYCAAYAQDPSGYAADSMRLETSTDAGVAAMVRARARVARRCAGFSPADGLGAQAVLDERVQAARAGSLASEASLLALGRPLQDSADYRRGLVQRVLASRDPQAFAAIAPAMGAAANGDAAYRGFVAGDQFALLAWQLAACRLGLDCGADSALMTGYCANAGICSRDATQNFSNFVFDAAVPGQGADKMDELVNTLIQTEGETS